MTKKVINRYSLSDYVYAKLGRTIHYHILYAVSGIIAKEIADELCRNQPVTIGNFGTLSPYLLPERVRRDFTGEKVTMPSTRSVKLHAATAFSRLLLNRVERFGRKDLRGRKVKRGS